MTSRPPSIKSRIDSWTDIYRRQGHRWGMIPSLCAHLGLAEINGLHAPAAKILDVGCGYGRDLAFFNHVFPSASLTGLDGSALAIKMARTLLPGRHLINRDLFEIAPQSLKGRFDLVFSNYFLHLLYEEEIVAALRLMRHSLKARGLVVCSFVSTKDRHYGRGRRVGQRCYEVAGGVPWRFTDEGEVTGFSIEAGLRVIAVRPYSEIELVLGRTDPVEAIYFVATAS